MPGSCAALFLTCQFGFRLHFLLYLVVLGIEFICMLFICSSVLRCDFSLACFHSLNCFLRDLWAGAGSSSSLYWSQAISVFLKSSAVEDKSLVHRSLTVPHSCRQPELTVLGQGSYSVFRISLYFLYLVTLSFPCESVNPCWQCKERKQENLRFKACLGYRAQNQLNNNKNSKILFQKELWVEMSDSVLA